MTIMSNKSKLLLAALVFFSASPFAWGSSDLIMNSCSFSVPNNPNPISAQNPAGINESIMIHASVMNVGADTATFPYHSRYLEIRDKNATVIYYDTAPSNWALSFSAVLGGAQFLFEPGQLAAGTYNFTAIADPEGVVSEGDESNNTMPCDLVVEDRGLPNITVENIVVTPESGTSAQNFFEAAITVTNSGLAAGTIPYSVPVFSCTGLSPLFRPNGVTFVPGKSQIFYYFIPGGAPPGVYTYNCMLDPNNSMPESNENDNTFFFSITVTAPPGESGKPDLTATCNFTPLVPTVADSIFFHGFLTNTGTATAYFDKRQTILNLTSGNLSPDWLYYDAPSAPISVGTESSISSGQYLFMPGQLAPGTHNFTITADPNNVVDETNENNNSSTCSFTVVDIKPDLTISGVTVSPVPAMEGDKVTVTLSVLNRGSIPAVIAWQTNILDCGEFGMITSSSSDTSWAPGETKNFTLERMSVAAGTYNYTCTVDPASYLPETDETNNIATVSFTVGSGNRPPVLSPIGNKTVTEGSLLQFQVIGNDPDNNSLTYAVSNLPAGATFDPATRSFSWTPGYAQAGTYPAVLFTVTDNGTPPASASEAVAINVGNANVPPVPVPTGGGTYQITDSITLGGSVSDFDGDLLTYKWLEGATILSSGLIQSVNGGVPVGLTAYTISHLSLGQHTLTLQVEDGSNQPVSTNVDVVIIDTIKPTLVPVADKPILWPPNHKMVNVTIYPNASDTSGNAVKLTASVTSNEPQRGLGKSDLSPDWTVPAINNGIITLQLRAERSDKGNGRIYTITIVATDEANNSSTAQLNISVPHDERDDDKNDDRHDDKKGDKTDDKQDKKQDDKQEKKPDNKGDKKGK